MIIIIIIIIISELFYFILFLLNQRIKNYKTSNNYKKMGIPTTEPKRKSQY